MTTSLITEIFLPLALAIIMFGMGLTLSTDDFKRIIIYPKAVTLGLINQLIILPILGFLVVIVFPLSPLLTVGVMILTFCPGGATSNLISHLAKADLALSITLTALSSIVTVFTIPFLTNLSIEYFAGESKVIELPILQTIIGMFLITILPVVIGMLIKGFAPDFAKKSEQPLNIFSIIFFVLVLAGAIWKEKDNIVSYFLQTGLSLVVLNVLSMLISFISSRSVGLSNRQSITIALESGIQNGTLAIFITSTLLQSTEMATPAAVYSLIMFMTAIVVVFISRRVVKA